jgi:hypothetical protein
MAHSFTISDGTTTFSLVATNALLRNYQMAVPQAGEDTVTDTVELLIYAASGALMQTATRTLQTLLEDAERRARTGLGARVFVNATLDSDGSAWRSELVRGRLEPKEDALAVWPNFKYEATLYLERRPWWEGALAQIPLTNSNATADTTGLTLWNHDDAGAGHDNYAQIAATDVTGALPAPVKIEIKNTVGAARAYTSIHLANNAFSDPANFTHILEAESRDNATGTITADSTASGGNRLDVSVSAPVADVVRIPLSAALLQDCAGRWFRVLVRVVSFGGQETMQAVITDSTGTYGIWPGPEVYLGTVAGGDDHVDLGALPFPPGGYDTSWGAMALQLEFSRASSTTNVTIDYVALLPADNYRKLAFRGPETANNAIVVDDPIEGLTYYEVGGARLPLIVTRGAPLQVWPGRLQRVYLYEDNNTGLINQIDDTFAVRMWYRPRRVTI